jgi:hypothetical protein
MSNLMIDRSTKPQIFAEKANIFRFFRIKYPEVFNDDHIDQGGRGAADN